MEETIYTFKNAPAQTQDASLREYADAQRIQRSALAAPAAKAEVPDDFGSAEHWKEKAQYWAGVAHELRGQALRGEPVDGIIQPSAHAEVQPKTAELPKGVAQFTKKPVTINAIQWDGKNLYEVISFTQGVPNTRSERAQDAWDDYAKIVEREGLHIDTLEGKMLANVGDWIIRGVKGEHYPCKPDIFAATYETATAPQAKKED